MSWRKDNRRQKQTEQPFSRQWGHEIAKEGSGTVVQQLGAGLGALAGLLSSRWGLPPTAVTIAGALLGNAVSVVGKGLVNTILDRRRESRTSGGGPEAGSGGPGSSQPLTSIRSRYPGHQGRDPAARSTFIRRGSGRTSGGGGNTGSYLHQLRRILDEIETQQAKLANVANAMRASQLGLAQLLAGGRQDRTQEIYTWAELSRANIEDAAVLTYQAQESLKGYLSNL
ncbi:MULTISPECIES: hypothetical protein [unclassified Micromonospora]|uniref:hypothetical protein n=1 Tax=unclassified Micromonospora TaxID=2617518 RepID=UPI003A8C30D5